MERVVVTTVPYQINTPDNDLFKTVPKAAT
jgi:hypothetical protein